MKISADPYHEDYHDVVHFVTGVTIDGSPLKTVVNIDTDANESLCYTQPIKVLNGTVMKHTVKGKIEIIWRGMGEPLFEHLKKDWEQREMLRKLEQHAI